MMTIGIIGQGFVGSAIREGLKNFHQILTYDIDETKCNQTLEQVCKQTDIIFICVPTPMRKDGSCDTRILEDAIGKAYDVLREENRLPRHSDFLNAQKHKKIFVVKSTVPPGTTERIANKHKGVDICFSPEFLTVVVFTNKRPVLSILARSEAFTLNLILLPVWSYAILPISASELSPK